MKKVESVKMAIILMLAVASYAADYSKFGSINMNMPKYGEIEMRDLNRVEWARIAQCQIRFKLTADSVNGLYKINASDSKTHQEKMLKCLDSAVVNKSNVLIYPELSLAMDSSSRKLIIKKFIEAANLNDMIIIAGSYYTENRQNRGIVIDKDSIYAFDKFRPSKIETNVYSGYGMVSGDCIIKIKSKYGNYVAIICADFISDDVQYIVRKLSNLGEIDMAIVISYNPASWEFMREASSIVKRHPLFISITNADTSSSITADNGDNFGNSSIFASTDPKNDLQAIKKYIFDSPFVKCGADKKSCAIDPAYSTLISYIRPSVEGVLISDINLKMNRSASVTNAPDQGYPTIKNVKRIEIK